MLIRDWKIHGAGLKIKNEVSSLLAKTIVINSQVFVASPSILVAFGNSLHSEPCGGSPDSLISYPQAKSVLVGTVHLSPPPPYIAVCLQVPVGTHVLKTN